VIGRPSCRCRRHALEAQRPQIQLVHKDIHYPGRIVLRHVVIKATGEQRRLSAVITFDEAGHLKTPNAAALEV